MRILAHKIIFRDKEYPLSVVEISDDNLRVKIEPFSHETANTTFQSGTVLVLQDLQGRYSIVPVNN